MVAVIRIIHALVTWHSLVISSIFLQLYFTGPGTCFYVEANAVISPGDGTLTSPFANFTDALQKVATVQVKNANYHVVILPKTYNDELQLIGTISYNKQMNVSI